jgi:hypothetical protein
VLWVLCVVRYRSLRRADPSSRGVLPTVVCHCVWSRNLEHEAVLARVGLLRQKQTHALITISIAVGQDSSVGILTRYRLDGPGIES